MKTPEKIKLHGHDLSIERELVRVSDDLYKVSFPENEELEKHMRVAFDRYFTSNEKGDHICAIDPPGGPYITVGYRINPFYIVKELVGDVANPLVRIQKNTKENIKLKFGEPVITYDGDNTYCRCFVQAEGFDKCMISVVAIRKDPDIYDANIGKAVAISKMQQAAYRWFNNEIKKRIRKMHNDMKILYQTYDIIDTKLQHERNYVKKF